MKRKFNRILVVLAGLTTVFMTGGCNRSAQNDNSLYKNIHWEEVVHLTDDASSPYCDLALDFSYLNEEGDSVAMFINRAMQREVLGDTYFNLLPEVAVDSFKNNYIREYREDIQKLLVSDSILVEGTNENSFPAWYNRTYSLLTFFDEGHQGIINVCADIFVDLGGAHPNQWSRWMNFKPTDGSMITLEEVFPQASQPELKRLLLNVLIRQQADLHSNENIETVEDLQKIGFLKFTEMYIPDNFLLGKETVSFLFNRYDIAPYAAGSIVIELSYKEIGTLINERIWN